MNVSLSISRNTMNVRYYGLILWRRHHIIVITTLSALIVGAIGILASSETVYSTSVMLRMTPGTGTSVDYNDLRYVDRLMTTYEKVAVSSPILEEVSEEMGVPDSQIKLLDINMSTVGNTELLRIVVKGEDPTLITDAANTLATVMIKESVRTRVGRDYPLSVLEPAVEPRYALSSSTIVPIVLVTIVGLVGGVVLAFLVESLDTALQTRERIAEVTGVPIIGDIPVGVGKEPIAFSDNDALLREAYRDLRTNLLEANHSSTIKTLLLTSTQPREGKSTILTNLAVALALLNKNILLIDANLRQPVLHTIFNIPNGRGLHEILSHVLPPDECVQKTQIPNVSVITSGQIAQNPAELLGSPTMVALLKLMSSQFDMVLLDTPAVLSCTDAIVLATMVDGVFFTIEISKAEQEAVENTLQKLRHVKGNLVGVVVNRVARQKLRSYQYSDIPGEETDLTRTTTVNTDISSRIFNTMAKLLQRKS